MSSPRYVYATTSRRPKPIVIPIFAGEGEGIEENAVNVREIDLVIPEVIPVLGGVEEDFHGADYTYKVGMLQAIYAISSIAPSIPAAFGTAASIYLTSIVKPPPRRPHSLVSKNPPLLSFFPCKTNRRAGGKNIGGKTQNCCSFTTKPAAIPNKRCGMVAGKEQPLR